MTERQQGWEQRLLTALDEVKGWQYQVGQHDCITMVCRVVEALTGSNPWPQWAGKYSTPLGAMKLIIAEAGGEAPYLRNAVTRVLGVQPSSVRTARRGDVVAFDLDTDPHLGILLHTEIVGFGPNGLFYQPAASCDCCWRIG